MRVLYIVTAYPRASDDLITPWLIGTIRRLSRVGVDVEVLAPAYRGLGDQVIEGVRVHRFRYAPVGWESLTHDQTAPDRIRERPWYLGLVPAYVAAGSLAAARLARSGRFDLVHVFWPIPHAVLGVAAKRAAHIPLVSTFFGVELTWLRSSFGFLRPVLRWLVGASDTVTAISSYTAATLRELAPAARPVIVPFGATVELVQADALRPRPADSAYTVLFVGRLVERKGVEILLRAMHRLRAESDIRLHVVGDGPLRHQLEQRARDSGLSGVVRFLGQVPETELAAEFAGCDVFVLPAVVDAKGDTEGLGVVLLEALAHGRPVIASAVGGIPDIVLDGRTGQLVPPGDPDALAGAIRKYRDDPALAARHAEAGRQHLEERFSWDGIVQRLLDVYRRTIVSARSARHPIEVSRWALRARSGDCVSAKPRVSRTDTAALEPRYLALLESERVHWWDTANFDTWKNLYVSEYARGFYVRDLLGKYAPGFPLAGSRVLDIGCGDAGVIIALAESGARVSGLELDRKSLARGRVRAEEHGVRAGLVAGVAEALPFRSGSLDLVILDNVLEHVLDRKRTLAEIHRVLRRDGLLYMVTPKPLSLHSLWNDPHYDLAGLVLMPRKMQIWYFEKIRGGGEGTYDVGVIPTRPALRRLLSRAGFEPLVSPRELWINYLRERVERPEEVQPGLKRRLARWVTRQPWLFRNPAARWFWDIALGSNFFLARRLD